MAKLSTRSPFTALFNVKNEFLPYKIETNESLTKISWNQHGKDRKTDALVQRQAELLRVCGTEHTHAHTDPKNSLEDTLRYNKFMNPRWTTGKVHDWEQSLEQKTYNIRPRSVAGPRQLTMSLLGEQCLTRPPRSDWPAQQTLGANYTCEVRGLQIWKPCWQEKKDV